MNLWAFYKCSKDHQRKMEEFMENARKDIYENTFKKISKRERKKLKESLHKVENEKDEEIN